MYPRREVVNSYGPAAISSVSSVERDRFCQPRLVFGETEPGGLSADSLGFVIL